MVQYLRRSGSNPGNIVALPIKEEDARATQPLEQISCSKLLRSELGVRRTGVLGELREPGVLHVKLAITPLITPFAAVTWLVLLALNPR